jgi:VCBS repeat-containing protein
MPKYDVTLTHTLTFTGTLTVRAKDEEAAQAKAQTEIEEKMGVPIAWTVNDGKYQWECDADETTIEEVTEV